MNDTPGIEEELKTRLSEIVNKDLSKRQVEKIVELFAPDKGNTITDEEIRQILIKENIWDEVYNTETDIKIFRLGYKANQFKHSLPVSDEDELKDWKDECERLAKIVDFWQKEYYKVCPPHQNTKIDNF